MKKKIVLILLIIAVVIVAVVLGPTLLHKFQKKNIITSSQLQEAIDISELSTAEFVYNGIVEKYDEEKQKIECQIAYDARVKVGIDMKQVTFEIDEDNKTVTPVLPDISVNIASIDPESLSYIPKNPNMELDEIVKLCKADAIEEANNTPKLYETAEENLRTTIEALLIPLLDSAGYSIQW